MIGRLLLLLLAVMMAGAAAHAAEPFRLADMKLGMTRDELARLPRPANKEDVPPAFICSNDSQVASDQELSAALALPDPVRKTGTLRCSWFHRTEEGWKGIGIEMAGHMAELWLHLLGDANHPGEERLYQIQVWTPVSARDDIVDQLVAAFGKPRDSKIAGPAWRNDISDIGLGETPPPESGFYVFFVHRELQKAFLLRLKQQG
jgi:hypothetical protein